MHRILPVLLVSTIFSVAAHAQSGGICEGYGPQAPRDIDSGSGSNPVTFSAAPTAAEMNLCNMHFHKNAEHRAPGYPTLRGAGTARGFVCASGDTLSEAERAPAPDGAACGDVVPGDTIEMHWVYTSCPVAPGPGLASCSAAACANPQLRVEAQVFLVVNDEAAADLADFDYAGLIDGRHQPGALPDGAGAVSYAGSTTGPSFSAGICSPLQVTWNVRPACQKLSLSSLRRWCEDNRFDEAVPQGVRPLVVAPSQLSQSVPASAAAP